MKNVKDSIEIKKKKTYNKLKESNESIKSYSRNYCNRRIFPIYINFRRSFIFQNIAAKRNSSSAFIYVFHNKNYYSLIAIISIAMFLLVSFSDPGKLTEDFKTTQIEKSIKTLEDQAKSNQSNHEDFDFRDDLSNSQSGYNSNDNLGRASIKIHNENVYKKSNFNDISIEMNNLYQSRKDRNKNSAEKELQICVDDTVVDSNYCKYYTSKNKMKRKIDFDEVFDQSPIANTVSSAYESNSKENNKLKKGNYLQIPISDQNCLKDNSVSSPDLSKDNEIEAVQPSSVVEGILNKIEENPSSNPQKIENKNEPYNALNQPIKKPEEDYTAFTNYCTSCLIDQPLRAKHCKICNKCICTFDHHCSWVSNCIGEKNKRIFLLFLTSHAILLGFGIIISILNFEKSNLTRDWVKINALIFINTLMISLFFTFVLSLLVFQLQIILVNQSTWENYSWHKINYMIKLSKSQKSPFNRGLIKNLTIVLCYKRYYTKKKESYLNEHINWISILEVKN